MNDALRQQKSRRRRRQPQVGALEALSRQPATLPLQAYRDVDPHTTDQLVKEFGAASALRILNGKPCVIAVAPADPATVAPPGAKAIPRIHQTKGERRMRETSG